MAGSGRRTLRDGDTEMREGEASSAPHTSRHATFGAPMPMARCHAAAAPAVRWRESGRRPRTPSPVASSGPLAAARKLLRNPPTSTASPDTLKQWRDDVERLLHLAQATPGSARTGPRLPPDNVVVPYHQRRGGESASVRSPTVRSARTDDLRVELNRRCAGDDARIAIERARERRLNIEGQNLDADLDAAAPKPLANDHTQAGSPMAAVGCAALADHLRVVAWPSKFSPHLPEKYDGMTNPSEFLHVYVTAIMAAGRNDAIMASYFHVAMTGPVRTWLMNLTPGSIQTWEEFCVRFTMNFASAYQ